MTEHVPFYRWSIKDAVHQPVVYDRIRLLCD